MTNVWPQWFTAEYLAAFAQSVIEAKPEARYICITTQAEIYSPRNYIAESIPPPRSGVRGHLTSFDTAGWIYIPTPREDTGYTMLLAM